MIPSRSLRRHFSFDDPRKHADTRFTLFFCMPFNSTMPTTPTRCKRFYKKKKQKLITLHGDLPLFVFSARARGAPSKAPSRAGNFFCIAFLPAILVYGELCDAEALRRETHSVKQPMIDSTSASAPPLMMPPARATSGLNPSVPSLSLFRSLAAGLGPLVFCL